MYIYSVVASATSSSGITSATSFLTSAVILNYFLNFSNSSANTIANPFLDRTSTSAAHSFLGIVPPNRCLKIEKYYSLERERERFRALLLGSVNKFVCIYTILYWS